MSPIKTTMAAGGKVVIPAEYRRALGLKPGDHVIMALEDDEIRIMTPDRSVRHAQSLVRSHVPEGRDMAEELVRERREEAANG
jgi:AbrB family looped-hinge helix DNA binding protein